MPIRVNSPTRKRDYIFCFQFSEPLKHCSFASPFMLRGSLQENVKRLSLEQLHFSASILFPKKERTLNASKSTLEIVVHSRNN